MAKSRKGGSGGGRERSFLSTLNRWFCFLNLRRERSSYSINVLTDRELSSKSSKSSSTSWRHSNKAASSWTQAIHTGITQRGEIDPVLDAVIQVVKNTVGYEFAGFVVLNNKQSKYYSSYSFQIPEDDVTRGIGLIAVLNKQVVKIPDVKKDTRYNHKYDNTHRHRVTNFICGPVLVNDVVFGILYAGNKRPQPSESIFGSVSSRVIPDVDEFQEVLTNTAIALTTSTTIASTIREQKRTDALIAVMKANTADKSLINILRSVVDIVDQLLLPQNVSVFLCDAVRQETFVCASNCREGFEGYTVEFGLGFAGWCASRGDAVRVNQAGADERFIAGLSEHMGSAINSVLCVPVPGFANINVPIAVIQVVNKKNGQEFDEDDEGSLTQMSAAVSSCLLTHAEELFDFQSILESRLSSGALTLMESSLLGEFGSDGNRFLLSSSAKKVIGVCEEMAHSSKLTAPHFTSIKAIAILNNYNTDPFAMTNDELIELVVHMFKSYDLLVKYHIEEAVLMRFVQRAHDLYHEDVAYHNFKHVWSVAHLCYQILLAGADQYLTSLDILALLIAAICHDIDHPGNNNAFEVACQTNLSILFSDDTVLERHHTVTTHNLLAIPEINFLKHLHSTQRLQVRKQITSAIMATDMSCHYELITQLNSLAAKSFVFDKHSFESRKLLVKVVLHAADTGAQTQNLVLALKWSDCVSREFTAQWRKELKVGLIPTVFMQDLHKEAKRMSLQKGFVSGVVLPLWESIVQFFPSLQACVDRAHSNLEFYNERVRAIKEEADDNTISF